MTMPRKFLAGLGLAAFLWLAPAASAQPPAPEAATEESDDSLYGYIGTGLLSAMAIFAVCRSARR